MKCNNNNFNQMLNSLPSHRSPSSNHSSSSNHSRTPTRSPNRMRTALFTALIPIGDNTVLISITASDNTGWSPKGYDWSSKGYDWLWLDSPKGYDRSSSDYDIVWIRQNDYDWSPKIYLSQ